MKEVYLYMCEECGMCMFENSDKGMASYSTYCVGCKQGSFFKKVVTQNYLGPFGDIVSRFVLLEKKNDSKTSEK